MNGLIQQLSSYGVSQDLILKAVFYSIAGLTCLFACLVVLSSNIFRSAIYLALTLLGVACVYIYLDAEFLAIAQVIIYVGAVVTLFLFTIMLTSDVNSRSARPAVFRLLIAACAVLAVFFFFLKIIHKNPWQTNPNAGTILPFDLAQLGTSLMSKYGLPFEVISLLSLAALVGAIAIGRSEKK